jgi:hypothetical protein
MKISAHLSGHVEVTAKIDARYFFAPQFLMAAAFFSKQAADLELQYARGERSNEELVEQHRAFVVGSVMQACSALEAEISTVLLDGPGHQLGSNGIDHQAARFLRPVAAVFDKLPTLARYSMTLHLLGKRPLDKDGQGYEMADLLVKLRNELVHYKAQWGIARDGPKLVKRLEHLGHPAPPYLTGDNHPFPLRYLSTATAAWATSSALALIDEFYRCLEVANPFDAHRGRIAR